MFAFLPTTVYIHRSEISLTLTFIPNAMKKFKSLGTKQNFLAIEKGMSSFESSKIVVVQAPYEHTVSYGGGAKRGPQGIITASQYVEFYDDELDRELCKELGIATLPPIQFGKKSDARAMRVIQDQVEQLLDLDKFVVTLGGEHTITQATVAAHLKKYPDMSVIQLDAHSDLRESYQGNKYSHASVMARVCELMDPKKIVQVGIRAQCIEEARYIKEKDINTFFAHNIRGGYNWGDGVMESLGDEVYVTFDVDGFDPSIMPSTGTPEPNGLFWAETVQLLRRIGEQKRIVGFDVVELAPVKGVSHPDLTAAKLTYKMMNYAFLKMDSTSQSTGK
jgi:agmatinase